MYKKFLNGIVPKDKENELFFVQLFAIVKFFGYSWQEVLELTPDDVARHLGYMRAIQEMDGDNAKI